jgi:hypothetical protein
VHNRPYLAPPALCAPVADCVSVFLHCQLFSTECIVGCWAQACSAQPPAPLPTTTSDQMIQLIAGMELCDPSHASNISVNTHTAVDGLAARRVCAAGVCSSSYAVSGCVVVGRGACCVACATSVLRAGTCAKTAPCRFCMILGRCVSECARRVLATATASTAVLKLRRLWPERLCLYASRRYCGEPQGHDGP